MNILLRAFLVCIANLLSASLYSQDINIYKRDSTFIGASEIKLIDINANYVAPKNTLPFKSFIFIDVRADTSCIGTKVKRAVRNKNKRYDKIALLNGTATALGDYINTLFSPGQDTMNLVCFIKQLRVTELDTVYRNSKGQNGVYHRLRFSVESYIQNNNTYFPALRLDTTITSFDLRGNDYNILSNVLHILVQKASLLNIKRCLAKHAYKSDQIQNRYSQRFYLPVLTDVKLKKGVYRSFAEFINNSPSVPEYEFIKDRVATILYTKDNSGKFVPEMSAVGFCDGKIIWLNVNNTLRPLIRQQNTFAFVFEKNISQSRPQIHSIDMSSVQTASASLLAEALSEIIENNQTRRFVYELDLESGIYY